MLYDSALWLFDINQVMSLIPELDELAGTAVLITGAGGLICSAVVDILIRFNETHHDPINILVAARSEQKIRNRFGAYCDKPYFTFVPYDATSSVVKISVRADYIIHGASNASPIKIIEEPVETMVSNFTGLLSLLTYAKVVGTKRLLYISSSEVYGINEGNLPYREDQYGYVDLLKSRNSYSVGKRTAETLCVSYTDEYGVDTVVVRPGHIYGPTASDTDNRVSSAWAYAVACGKNIVMKSDGSQIRSYCYCLDCASAILKVLLKGKSVHAYNISNPDSIISIKQMAELLSKTAGVQLIMELPTEKDKQCFNPMSNSSLESISLQALGWKGLFDAPTGFDHTVRIIRENMEEKC